MVQRFGRLTEYGRTSSGTELFETTHHHGQTQSLLDSDDASVISDGAGEPYVGYFTSSTRSERAFALIRVKVPAEKITGHEISKATLRLGLAAVNWSGVYSPVSMNFHVVDGSVDLTDVTWDQRDDSANLFWAEVGGKLGVDVSATPSAQLTISQTLYDQLVALTATNNGDANPIMVDVDITTAVRDAAARGATSVILQVRPTWAKPAIGVGNTQRFKFQDVDTRAGYPHTYVIIEHAPPESFFAVNPDGTINYGGFLDYTLTAERSARIQTGSPSPGTQGPPKIAGVGNTTDSDITSLWLIRSGGWAETPSRPASRRWPRKVHVFDTVGSNGYIRGRTRMAPMVGFESTRYECYVTPFGAAEIATPLSTALGNAWGQYDRDETFLYSAKNAFIVKTEWWGITPLTAIVGDETWTFEHLADQRPAGFTQAAAERHQMTYYSGAFDPDVADDRLQPDERWWRPTWNATVEQLARASRVATISLTPEGSIPRTCLPVGSVDYLWAVGQTITVAEGANVEHAVIRGFIARTDPTHPDELVLDRELDYTYTDDAKAGNAIYVGDHTARDRRYLNARANAGQGYLEFTEPIGASSGTLRVYNRVTGLTEAHSYTRDDNRAVFAPGDVLINQYEVGDFAYRLEITSWSTFFVRLAAEEGALTEEQLSLIRVIRKGTK